MDTSLAHENARLRALLQTQQDTIRQMAEYNRLLSQRVAAYASEINRLKALVAKLQRMQFGKSSEKLRAKTERQIQEAQECQRQDYWPFFAIFNVRYWSLMLSAFRHFIITDWRGVFCQHSRFAFFL